MKTLSIILIWILPVIASAQFSNSIIIDSMGVSSKIEIVDLNGDGKIDIFSNKGDELIWYRNEGQGIFSNLLIIEELEEGPGGFGYGDMDNDGDIDILSGSFVDGDLRWYENNGNQEYLLSHTITDDINSVNAIAVEDIDDDGFLDVVVSSMSDSKIVWYANDGVGNFSAENVIVSGVINPDEIKASDIDMDGDQDIIAAIENSREIAVYKNDGVGNFSSGIVISENLGSVKFNCGDMDGDQDIDIFYANFLTGSLSWNENIGNGEFGTSTTIGGSLLFAEYVYLADLNNDNFQDIIVAEAEEIALYYSDGEENYSNIVGLDNNNLGTCRYASSFDFDNDGDNDIIANVGGHLVLYRNDLISSIFESSLNEFEVNLYPNPTSNLLIVEADYKVSELSIVDSYGKIIKTIINSNSIQVGQLKSGPYYCLLDINGQLFCSKFTKF